MSAQLDLFADMLQNVAKNLEDSIFTDERLGKRILSQLKRKGIRVLSMHFLVNGEGKYELHLTMRTWKAEKIPVKSLAGILSNLTGRRLIPGKEGAPVDRSGLYNSGLPRRTILLHNVRNSKNRKRLQ